jgi:quercetin dioxygenase-like cupin family protein
VSGELRRIVTGNDATGKSVVVIDGPAVEGEIWATDSTPADNSVTGDQVRLPVRLEPPRLGSTFRYAVIEPEDPKLSPQEFEERVARRFEARGGTHCRVDTSRHPAMHTTRTIDYIVVLSGEITLILDKGEVDLKPFDVVVQRGTNHSWVNKGKEPALLAAILIDAKPL